MDIPEEDEERFVEEFSNLLKSFGELVDGRPELIDSLRDNLKMSAEMMVSDRAETKKEFRSMTEDIDAFLHSVKTGEIDLNKFLGKKEEE